MSSVDALRLTFEVLVFLGILYLAFLKNYFQEKGKNLATKEDIEEITSKVEAIKTRLNFSAQAKLSLAGQAQAALIDYFSKYAVWLNGMLDCGAATMNYDDAALEAMRERLDALHRDFDLSASKMSLLVENEEIRLLHLKISADTLEFLSHAYSFTFSCHSCLIDARELEMIKDSSAKVEKFRQHYAHRSEIHIKFKTEQKEMYRTLAPTIEAMRRAIAAEIRELAAHHAAA